MNVLKMINFSVGIVLIILLFSAGIYLNKLLNKLPGQQIKVVLLKSTSTCDLNKQACVARFAQQTVELQFKQAVKYLTPFDLEVAIKGFDLHAIDEMSIVLHMVDMSMGINQFSLRKVDKTNTWQGLAILPVCASGRNDWRVELHFSDSESSYKAVYNLVVQN